MPYSYLRYDFTAALILGGSEGVIVGATNSRAMHLNQQVGVKLSYNVRAIVGGGHSHLFLKTMIPMHIHVLYKCRA